MPQGRPKEREINDPFKSSRSERVSRESDSKPWTLNGQPPRRHAAGSLDGMVEELEKLVAAPPPVGRGSGQMIPKPPKESARVRRISREVEEGQQRLMDIRPLEEVVLNLRRGEVR